jgi:hypothetical protein
MRASEHFTGPAPSDSEGLAGTEQKRSGVDPLLRTTTFLKESSVSPARTELPSSRLKMRASEHFTGPAPRKSPSDLTDPDKTAAYFQT